LWILPRFRKSRGLIFLMALPLKQQQGVRRANRGHVMMSALPFLMFQSEFLLQLLIVLFRAPAEFGQPNQAPERDPLGQCGEPILGRELRLARACSIYSQTGCG
jgi:hypothetical protein